MKNQNNDEIDKLLSEYFENIEIPDSTQKTIDNTLNELSPPSSHSYKRMGRVAVIIFTMMIISSGAIFAKDIITFFTSLFTNSTQGIDDAVANGYIQNIDMDYIYDNGIGIKVESIVMDDNNLDISYKFKLENNDENKITEIIPANHLIKNQNEDLIYSFSENDNYLKNNTRYSTNCYIENFKSIKEENNTYISSIRYTSNKFPKSSYIQIEISSISIISNNLLKTQNGNWIFKIDLDKFLAIREVKTFSASNNPFIKDISCNLKDTTMNISIKLNTLLNNDILLNKENIFLMNSKKEKITYSFIKSRNFNNYGEIYLEFDLSKYSKNTNKFELYVRFDKDKYIDINLK